MLAQKLMGSVGGASDKLYVDDVFSTYLYTGNGSTQTINNGIDLAGKGGLVWVKPRSGTYAGNSTFGKHSLVDTVRGPTNTLFSSTTEASVIYDPSITQFNSSGFGLGAGTRVNEPSHNYASWTFRKAPKFFDVVTYTGNGANQNIPHPLGVQPGMVICKSSSASSNWGVWSKGSSATDTGGLSVNSTALAATLNQNNAAQFTVSTFNPNCVYDHLGAALNTNGVTYVAYLFAHDPSADGIIQCGSFTTDGSGNATVNLGWEPQYVKLKSSSAVQDWYTLDSMRGMGVSSNSQMFLTDNTSAAEGTTSGVAVPNATGFSTVGFSASRTYIYMAIRRPNKPPTTGTEVYNAIARTGTGAAATVTGVGFAPDVIFNQQRNAVQGNVWYDRLRGATRYLAPASTALEGVNSQAVTSFDMGGMSLGTEASVNGVLSLVHHFFKRAPGFFDVVCYESDGTYNPIAHGLGVVPELVIQKIRDEASAWFVYDGIVYGYLNSDLAFAAFSRPLTATTFVPLTQGNSFVTYLFASFPGISKVGSYTGNGGTQTIACGFATGARFILIKRTNSKGDWYIWDTTRGIVSANDPHLSLNTTAAEVTTDDSVDPANSGFIVNQAAATNINVTGGSYIFLAIS